MRETTNSVRAYFVIAGAFALLLGMRDLSLVSKLGDLLGSLGLSW